MPRLGLSTAYRPASLPEPRLLLDRALELGAGGLGVDPGLPRDLLQALLPTLRKRRDDVALIAIRAGGPPFLGSADRDERRAAELRLGDDLLVCGELACPLVLPLGRVGPPALWHALREAFVRGEDLDTELTPLVEHRKRHVERALAAARLGLERLCGQAERLGVHLGILPRGRPDELPDGHELAALLADFAGAPVGAWDDTARRYLDRLLTGADASPPAGLGQDLGDACGLMAPLAPGLGEALLDWKRPACDVVVRADPRSTDDEVRRALERARLTA